MWTFLNQLIDGLVVSGPILLVAVSLSSVLASSRVLNVAVGATYAFVAIVDAKWASDIGVVGFLAVGLLGPVILFLLLDTFVLSVQRRTSRDPEMASFAATLGVSLVLTAFAAMLSQSAVYNLPPGFLRLGRTWHFGQILLPEDGAVVVVAAGIMLVLLWLLLYRSSVGAQFRATASDPALARTVGIRPARIIRLSWVVSGLLAGVATILLLVVQRSVSSTSGGDVLLVPFAAVIAGGMGNPMGAALASVFFGVSESLLTLANASGGVQSALVFGLLFIVLIVRPEGLSSSSRSSRAY